ncbi:hypothetical protein [Oryzomonas rubra]|uniref:Decaheme-associated outer membrane protein, MtrB/PioB family n=1 Tax=Oryzomonas rubra TaxID=2509454 RepID=A0A5A9XEK7_9BACT|nr:hypothetical protein [Oryzomonas rubra]KAA0891350.1 hypothetical protein ET418_11240 [Oryzomonas rubra]
MSSRSRQTMLFAPLIVCSSLMFLTLPALASDGATPDAGGGNHETLSEQEAEAYRFAHLQAGYQFITPDGASAAAAPYTRLKSGAMGGFSAGTLGSSLKLSGEGLMLHEDDYHANLFFDYGGYYRLHLETEAFWHNLLTEQLPRSATGQYATTQSAPPADGYGMRTGISQVENRIKLGNNPIHINLGYWELSRRGTDQLRFADYYFSDPQNRIVSLNRQVNQVTREGSVGADAHLGFFDIAYGFRIRDFSNQAPDIRYPFAVTGNGTLTPGTQATNVASDSRVTSHTVRVYTDMSGGLVGTAAYVLTQRESDADRGDARPSSKPSQTLHSVAGDLTYTPLKELSFALKYRRLQNDRESPSTVSYPYSTASGALAVRPGIDSVKDTVTLSGTFRPNQQVTYRLEYRAVLESRDNVPNSDLSPSDPTAIHNEYHRTHTALATASWRPLPGFRMNATYTYRTADNPEWKVSASESHKGELFATYTKNGAWGATASFITTYEQSENSASTVTPAPVASYTLPRENRSYSANTSLWFTPVERLTITANYSYLEAVTDQSLLFSNIIVDPDPLVATTYRSTAHVYGIDAVYAVAEPLDLSVGVQQVRSASRFDVPVRTFTLANVTGSYNTASIGTLTRLDTVETGVTARADWRISKHVGCSMNYSYRNYNSGDALYDGSVHTTMVSLTSRW